MDSNSDTNSENSEMMINQTEIRTSPRKSFSGNSANDASNSSYKVLVLKLSSLDQSSKSSLEEMQSNTRQVTPTRATSSVRLGTTFPVPTNVVAMALCVNHDNINKSIQKLHTNDYPHAANAMSSGRLGTALSEPPDAVTMSAYVTCYNTGESTSDKDPNDYPHTTNVTSPGRLGTTMSEPPDAVAKTSRIIYNNTNKSDQDLNPNDNPHDIIVTPSGRTYTKLSELPDDTMVTSCVDLDGAKDSMSNSGTFDAAGVNECASGERVTKPF